MTWTAKQGAFIRIRREAAGMSQRDLANRVQMSPAWISNIETGKSSPSLETLQRIADVLQIPLTHLLGTALDVLPPDIQDVAQRPLVQQLLKRVATLDDEQLQRLLRVVDSMYDE